MERHRRTARYQSPPGQEPPRETAEAPSPSPRLERRAAQYSPGKPLPDYTYLPAPQDRIERKSRFVQEGDAPEKPRKRMPRLLTALMTLLFFVCAALFSGVWVMRGYLAREAQAAEEAHQQLVERHPIAYQQWIEQYAARNNLQPALVAAIILNESSFDPAAESSISARGLMQLRENTADWINNQYLHETGYAFTRMFDPECNIRFGCWYLGYLSRLFRGDPVCVVAAYHAGQGRVRDDWLQNPELSPDGQTLLIDQLPYESTKTYVRRVTRDYGIYDALIFHAFNSPDAAAGDADGGAAR
ncbi:MAG: lytic transglycosylase domain-containing protein [Clostridia bacterium]|nr:lytic transglycosylase domain-containing protein [Clostridia bacterium]